MVIVHSYVNLPESKNYCKIFQRSWNSNWAPIETYSISIRFDKCIFSCILCTPGFTYMVVSYNGGTPCRASIFGYPPFGGTPYIFCTFLLSNQPAGNSPGHSDRLKRIDGLDKRGGRWRRGCCWRRSDIFGITTSQYHGRHCLGLELVILTFYRTFLEI